MNDGKEKDRPEEDQEPTAESLGKRPRPDPDENSVSLLDIMREIADPPGPTDQAEEPSTPAPLISDQGQEDQDNKETGDDEATPTGAPAPSRIPKAPPIPLTAQDLQPTERPPERDEDATKVQPRSAFPGQTRIDPPSPEARHRMPISEMPTQPPRPRPRSRGRPAPAPERPLPQRPPVRQERPAPVRVVIPERQKLPKPQSRRQGRWLGCMGRLALVGVIVAVIGLVLTVATATIGYIAIASQLPLPSELRSRASTFETAQILDRNGDLLYSLADPNTGNRTFVPIRRISQELIDATIATEDARFYTNPGFDPFAIARAVLQAAQEGEVVSGASTITQQLARALLLDEDERTQVTFSRKVKEIVLAAEINRTYSKDEILELYLNEIYYGNLAYGIEAAAQTYFDKPAAELTLPEASLLAGLPQAPALWDPFSDPEKALGRQSEVLALMTAEAYITSEEAQSILDQSALVVYNLEPPSVTIRHPHFSLTVLQQLEAEIGAQAIYRGGLRIFTTLDPATQRLAEESIVAQRERINSAGANNAALVVVQPQTGEILALVGSVDFDDEAISGQVNMALVPRQPGSSIKPLVYLAAMERGWTPSTLLWDVPTRFPDGANPPYEPKNYDDEFHGPLRLRPALGNSYNIPAVKALEFIGVCDFLAYVPRLGISSLVDSGCQEVGSPRDYGLSLTLGGGEVSALEMAGAYSILANQGQYRRPFSIQRIENSRGELIFEYQPANPAEAQVIRADHAYLLSHILSDNNARQPEFGLNNSLVVSGHRVAAKTGTSGSSQFDVRDGWTIGYTPEVVTAVWVGNTDNSPVGQAQSGTRMAAPIWNAFMTAYLSSRQPVDFNRPASVVEVEICADSGARPGPGCQNRALEVFANDQLPPDNNQDFLKPELIDLWTNQVASEFCTEAVYEANFFNLVVNGRPDVRERERQAAQEWLERTGSGRAWADRRSIALPLRLPPAATCDQNTPRPEAALTAPPPSTSVSGQVEIWGRARSPGFLAYRLEYGLSADPQGWARITESGTQFPSDGLLGIWDTAGIQGGAVTIRLTVFGPDNPYTEGNDPVSLSTRVTLDLLEPTATPSPTPTDTATPTSTPTPTGTPTASPTPSATPTIGPTPTSSPTPTATPTSGSDDN